MTPIGSTAAFGEIAEWQRVLDRHHDLFERLRLGSRIGIVPREASGTLPGAGAPAMIWEAGENGMIAHSEVFTGASDMGLDLLLAADAGALAAMAEALNGNVVGTIKRQIRCGGMAVFVQRTWSYLQEAGYEDFLDTFGVAFLGACR